MLLGSACICMDLQVSPASYRDLTGKCVQGMRCELQFCLPPFPSPPPLPLHRLV